MRRSVGLVGDWQTTRALPGERDVHLWTVALDLPDATLKLLEPVLSTDEQSRAARFQSNLHRRRFVAGHGILRWLLASYCGVAPAELRFAQEAAGKPFLFSANEPCRPRFNLAHSDRLALIAVTASAPVGADIERVRDVPESRQIADRWFSMRERAAFLGAPFRERADVFIDIWTRKEAYVKALGHGLQDELNAFDVTPLAKGPVEIHTSGNGLCTPTGWLLYSMKRDADYYAAVALPVSEWTISCYDICLDQDRPSGDCCRR